MVTSIGSRRQVIAPQFDRGADFFAPPPQTEKRGGQSTAPEGAGAKEGERVSVAKEQRDRAAAVDAI
jgi:hypothetical protein